MPLLITRPASLWPVTLFRIVSYSFTVKAYQLSSILNEATLTFFFLKVAILTFFFIILLINITVFPRLMTSFMAIRTLSFFGALTGNMIGRLAVEAVSCSYMSLFWSAFWCEMLSAFAVETFLYFRTVFHVMTLLVAIWAYQYHLSGGFTIVRAVARIVRTCTIITYQRPLLPFWAGGPVAKPNIINLRLIRQRLNSYILLSWTNESFSLILISLWDLFQPYLNIKLANIQH